MSYEPTTPRFGGEPKPKEDPVNWHKWGEIGLWLALTLVVGVLGYVILTAMAVGVRYGDYQNTNYSPLEHPMIVLFVVGIISLGWIIQLGKTFYKW